MRKKANSEIDVQDKYLQFQLLLQQENQIEQAVKALNKQKEELQILKQSLEEISNTKKSSDLLVPLGGGIFLKATLNDNEEILMNVGAKTVIKKSPKEAVKIIENQFKEIDKVILETEKEHSEILVQQNRLQEELEGFIN